MTANAAVPSRMTIDESGVRTQLERPPKEYLFNVKANMTSCVEPVAALDITVRATEQGLRNYEHIIEDRLPRKVCEACWSKFQARNYVPPTH